MPQTPTLSPTQLDAIRALLPVMGDPPAVQAQKQEALKAVVTRLRQGGVQVSDPPGLFAGGGAGRPSGATGTWDAPSPIAGVPPMESAPLRGAGYGTAALSGVNDARGRADMPNRGAAFSADPRRRTDPSQARILPAPVVRDTGPTPRPVSAPGVPPMGAPPLAGTGYGTAALSGVETARSRADSPNRGAAFSADPRRRTSDSLQARVDEAVDQAVEMMVLTDPPQFTRAVIETPGQDPGRARKPTSLTGSPPVPGAGPRASAPGASLNLSTYTGQAPAAPPPPPSAATPGGPSLNLSDYLPEEDEEDADAPVVPASPPRPGSLNLSDYLGGGSSAAPPARVGATRPVAKNPPSTARASVPASYLGPDVETQVGATFARQAPPPMGSAGAQATSALQPSAAPPALLAPALQRQALEALLSRADVSSQVGGAPVALGDAPPPPEISDEPDPEVATMVAQLLAEARRGGPILDTFRRSRGGPQAYFGGK